LLGKEGIADYVTYCATKFGVIGTTQALAEELRGTEMGVQRRSAASHRGFSLHTG
jgi:short-subunit dehydrogenase